MMKITAFSTLVAAVTIAVFAAQGESKSTLDHSSALMPARRHHAKLNKRGGKFSGIATWYGIHEGDMGACGTALNANEYLVALNQVQYGNLNSQSSYCGKTITITNGQKTTQAKILDACPTGEQCHYGALDMSRSLFAFFNDYSVGEFDITWWVDGDGGSSGGSGGSSSSSPTTTTSASTSTSTNSNNDDDDSSATQAVDNSASRIAQKKKAAKKAAAAEAAKKEAAEAAEKKKEQEEAAAAEKKKEAAAKKAKAAAEKKKEAKEAKAKAQAAKIQKTQEQNLAAFGQIMETLNNMVTEAAGPSTTSTTASSAPSSSGTLASSVASSLAPASSSASSSSLPVSSASA